LVKNGGRKKVYRPLKRNIKREGSPPLARVIIVRRKGQEREGHAKFGQHNISGGPRRE